MKIKNLEMVAYMNHIGEIQKKRLPIKLSYALALNTKKLSEIANTYDAEFNRLKRAGDQKALSELVLSDFETEIQTVKLSDLAKMDENSNYDILTGEEYAIIDFMIDKE
jgi:hypothetical protein